MLLSPSTSFRYFLPFLFLFPHVLSQPPGPPGPHGPPGPPGPFGPPPGQFQRECRPITCPGGCCIEGTCALNSSDCHPGFVTFITICLPSITIISLAAIVICIRIARRRAENHRRRINHQEEVFHNIQQQLNLAATSPDAGVIRPRRISSPLAVRITRSLKIAPINTVELDVSSPASVASPMSLNQTEIQIIEIDHQEFQKKMMEDRNSSSMLQSLNVGVARGIGLDSKEKEELQLERNLTPINESEEAD